MKVTVYTIGLQCRLIMRSITYELRLACFGLKIINWSLACNVSPGDGLITVFGALKSL